MRIEDEPGSRLVEAGMDDAGDRHQKFQSSSSVATALPMT